MRCETNRPASAGRPSKHIINLFSISCTEGHTPEQEAVPFWILVSNSKTAKGSARKRQSLPECESSPLEREQAASSCAVLSAGEGRPAPFPKNRFKFQVSSSEMHQYEECRNARVKRFNSGLLCARCGYSI